MGITIHFRGKAADRSQVAAAIDAASTAGEAQGWAVQRFTKESATLSRDIDEHTVEYTGPAEGVILTPHELCEPLCLEFDRDGVAQDYVKTQFAGADTHVAVVELLRQLQPVLESLKILDEGEYWDTGDRALLERQIESCNAQLTHDLETDSSLHGPIRLENGRIVDLVKIDDGESTSRKRWWRFW